MRTPWRNSGSSPRHARRHSRWTRAFRCPLVMAAALAALTACGGDGSSSAGNGSPHGTYSDIVEPVYETLMTEAGYEAGRWAEDPDGSASLWATAFLYPWGRAAGDPEATERAGETLDRLLEDLAGPLPEDPTRLVLCLPACFAGLASGAGVLEEAVRPVVESFLNAMDRRAQAQGYYLEETASPKAPTELTALLAWSNLLYRDYWDWPRGTPYVYPGVGLALLDATREKAWDAEKEYYRARPWAHGLDIPSNGWMILGLMKGFENEELIPYQVNAEGAAAALEALRDKDRGGYFSSADSRDGLKTLAENNLAVTALLALYKNLADAFYLDRAEETLQFIADRMYADGKLSSVVPAGVSHGGEGWSAGENFHFLYNVLVVQALKDEACRNLLAFRPMHCEERSLPGGVSPGRSRTRYPEEFDNILKTVLYKVPWRDGDILYDYGDMPGYASWLLFDLAGETGEEEYAETATAVADRIVRLIHEDLVYYLAEISFGGFSLYAAKAHYGAERPVYEAELDHVLGLAVFLATLDDYYLDIVDRLTGGGNYGYGATTLTAQVAYLLFLSRYYPPDGFRPMWDEYPEVALKMVEAANREAWDEAGGYYYKSADQPEIYLMADGYMVYTLVEAYRYTGNPEHLDRARRVVAAMERILGDSEGGGFYAMPPALPSLGYKSLSSNSYALKACALLYHATGEEAYRQKAESALDFLLKDLYAGGAVHHHLYEGRACRGDMWCSGCNFRILQYMDYLDDLAKNGTDATKDRP